MGLDINLYTPKIDIGDDGADDIVIEITGLKSISKFIGLEDTPLYYDNGKFFKVEGNKIVYTNIEWKDISGNIDDAPEIVAVISDLVNEVASDIIDERINLHNLNEEAHPYIQNIIKQNYDTLDAKIDNTKEELSEALNTEIINRETADNELSENIQQETLARIEADTTLQNNIDTLNQTVINNYTELSEDIIDLTTTVSDNYNTLSGQIDSLSTTVDNNYTSLNNRLTTTEQNILDLTDIVGDNSSDITTIQNTINAYGDIVTYDAANFATKNQGELAETALQPNDNISELTNDVGYITSASLPTVNNATITVQKNGTDVGSFTLNQANNDTINVTVPTQASDIGALPNTTTIEDLTTTTQLAALNSGANTTNIGQITTNKNDIEDINGLIPNQATTSNQLADKSFVNSSIATNTAYFIGTFNSVAELEAYSGTLTNNDYAFVATVDTAGNTLYDRYKWTGTQWLFEYELNNSSFTAEQWGAINSGITSGNVALIETALQPNDNISELTNNVGYITAASLPTVNDATLTIQKNGANIGTFTANSATNSTVNVVVPTDTSDLTNNAGYATETYIDTELLNKQDTLTAGDNIQIINNVISAIDTTYTAGTGIDITNGVISNTQTSAQWGNITGTLSDQTDLQDALDAKQNTLTSENAGTNIEITGGNPTYEDVTVSGTSSVTLENAKENGLNYVKLFGACEQRDILPSEYQRVEYLENTGIQYIDTGVVVNTLINPRIVTTFKMVNQADIDWWGTNNVGSNTILWNVDNASTNTAWYVRWGSMIPRQLTNQSDLTSFNFTDFHTLDVGGVDVKQEIPIKIDGVLVNTMVANGNASLSNTSTILIFKGRSATGISQFKDFEIYSNDILILKLIPCRRKSDNVLGMYDTVTGNFLTNAGTGDFTAGADVTTPTPDYPMNIWCNNGVVKVSRNLFDKNQEVLNGWYNDTGNFNPSTSTGYTEDYIYVKPNTTYTINQLGHTSTDIGKTGVYFYDMNKNWISRITSYNVSSVTFTTPSNCYYVRFQVNLSTRADAVVFDKDTCQLEQGSTATPYMPYGQIYTDGTVETVEVDTTGGTATAEMLLKVGNYQDVQSILDGSVTRNVGVKVLDGTEAWLAQGGTRIYGYCYSLNTPLQNAMAGIDVNCYSTHFKAVSRCWDTATEPCFSFHQLASPSWTGKPFFIVEQDTAQKFNQWLADQYANGTPVIIVYPLAEPTTETVTGQALTIQEGTNVVSATGSVDSLPLEVEYVKQTIGGLKINFVNDSGFATTTELNTGLAGKQETLVSGTNIKTINGNSILGSGNLVIEGGGGSATWGSIGGTLSAQTDLQNALDAKQSTISDLSTIRSGASLGATALQPNDNITELVNNAGYITGITSSDVTTALGYTPYNATNPNGYTSNVGTVTSVNNVQPVNGNVTLSIPSAVTESTVSGWGFTKNEGTITGITMNGSSKGTSGVVNLGTVITAHQDISGKQDKANLVTSISSSSTDTQYPSAKCVYDAIQGDVEAYTAAEVQTLWSSI